jgi:hypothetical protein
MKRTIEQIEQQLAEAERQLKAYEGNRHAAHNVALANVMIASLKKELAERFAAE